jgi:hypothetical protein
VSQYRGNEIFNEYARLMIESGTLVSEAGDPTTRETVKEWSEETKLKDKEYRENIEILYGVRPNGDADKGKDDGFASILDEAHPMPLILCPSYDRVNGLVENLKERQDIMVGLVMKPQQAKQTQRRIAQLLQSELTSIAFQTDTEERQTALSKLADDCAERLEKKAQWVQVAMYGIPAILGLIALVQNVNILDQGVVADAAKAMDALHTFKPMAGEISAQLDELVDAISYVHDMTVKVAETKVEGKNLSESAASQANQNAIKLIQEYKRVARLLADKITSTYLPLIKSHQSVPEDSWKNDFWSGLKKVYHTFVPDEQHDLMKSLDGLASSLTKSVEVMDKKEAAINNYVKSNHDKLVDQLKEEVGKKDPVKDLSPESKVDPKAPDYHPDFNFPLVPGEVTA